MNKQQIQITVVVVSLIIIYLLLQKVGLLDTKEDVTEKKKEEKLKVTKGDAFNPTFYKGKPDLISESEAQKFSENINKSFGFFGFDEDEFLAVISQIPNIQSISFVTHTYNKKFGKVLKNIVNENFNTDWKVLFQQPLSGLSVMNDGDKLNSILDEKL